MPHKAPSRPKVPAASTAKPKTATKKPKTTPKKELSTAERLKRLFTSLCAQVDGGHFTNAIKTCDKILRLDPKDADALQTKLFLLLQTEQYASALGLLSTSELSSGGGFERAYCLYRIQREPEAADLLSGLKQGGDSNRGVLHLEAQLNYRQGSYQTAFDLYNELFDTTEPNTEEQSDILTNLQASQKHLDFISNEYLRVLDKIPTTVTSTLETAPPPVQSTSTLAANVGAFGSASVSATRQLPQQPAPKTVRARRVPKGVVPGMTPPPDPERWLKKSERSTFTQARGKRRGGGGAMQGVMETPGSAAGGQSRSGGGKWKKKK